MIPVRYRRKIVGMIDTEIHGLYFHVPFALDRGNGEPLFKSKKFKWVNFPEKTIGIDLKTRKDLDLVQRLSNYAPL